MKNMQKSSSYLYTKEREPPDKSSKNESNNPSSNTFLDCIVQNQMEDGQNWLMEIINQLPDSPYFNNDQNVDGWKKKRIKKPLSHQLPNKLKSPVKKQSIKNYNTKTPQDQERQTVIKSLCASLNKLDKISWLNQMIREIRGKYQTYGWNQTSYRNYKFFGFSSFKIRNLILKSNGIRKEKQNTIKQKLQQIKSQLFKKALNKKFESLISTGLGGFLKIIIGENMDQIMEGLFMFTASLTNQNRIYFEYSSKNTIKTIHQWLRKQHLLSQEQLIMYEQAAKHMGGWPN